MGYIIGALATLLLCFTWRGYLFRTPSRETSGRNDEFAPNALLFLPLPFTKRCCTFWKSSSGMSGGCVEGVQATTGDIAGAATKS